MFHKGIISEVFIDYEVQLNKYSFILNESAPLRLLSLLRFWVVFTSYAAIVYTSSDVFFLARHNSVLHLYFLLLIVYIVITL